VCDLQQKKYYFNIDVTTCINSGDLPTLTGGTDIELITRDKYTKGTCNPSQYSVNTKLTLDLLIKSLNRWPSVNWLICIDQKLVDSSPTINRGVDHQLSVNRGVNQVLIEYQSRVDQVSIKSIN